MPRRAGVVFLLSALGLAGFVSAQSESELRARARLFPEIGAGVTALKSRALGNSRQYFLLSARGTHILVYDAQGKRLAELAASPPTIPLAFGEDLDLTCPEKSETCRIYVADRGANAVQVYAVGPSGAPVHTETISVPAGPTSVAALSEGEVAVATARSYRLISVFDARGKLVREFGVQADMAQSGDLNRFLNIGRLAADPAAHVYYAFSHLPEPTVRKYDRFGFAGMEIELTTFDFLPTSQAARREIARQDARGGKSPTLRPVVNAITVDPETEEIWLGIGGLLLHFDSRGGRRGTYRLFTPEGARVEPAAILVEPDRLLIASKTLGVFEFPRPEKEPR